MGKKVIIISFVLVALSAQAKVKQVSVCWEDGLKPPYLMLNAQEQPIGIVVEMVSKIFTRNQIKVKHEVKPWKRCLAELKAGRIDIVPNSSYKEKRKKFAYFTKAFYETHLMIFYNKSEFPQAPKIKTVEDLFQYKVGGVFGFNYTFYKDYEKKMDTGAKTREKLISKLKLKRVQLAVLQREVMLGLQKDGKTNLSGLGMVPDPVKPMKAYHVLVGHKHPEAETLIQTLDRGLDRINSDGTAKKIIAKYLGS